MAKYQQLLTDSKLIFFQQQYYLVGKCGTVTHIDPHVDCRSELLLLQT
jgi:hypothetical protein